MKPIPTKISNSKHYKKPNQQNSSTPEIHIKINIITKSKPHNKIIIKIKYSKKIKWKANPKINKLKNKHKILSINSEKDNN